MEAPNVKVVFALMLGLGLGFLATALLSISDAAIPPVGLALLEMKSAPAPIQISPSGALLVEGLDDFIHALQPVGYQGGFLLVQDNGTGAQYLIKKVK